MLDMEPTMRIDAKSALSHLYFDDIDKDLINKLKWWVIISYSVILSQSCT